MPPFVPPSCTSSSASSSSAVSPVCPLPRHSCLLSSLFRQSRHVLLRQLPPHAAILCSRPPPPNPPTHTPYKTHATHTPYKTHTLVSGFRKFRLRFFFFPVQVLPPTVPQRSRQNPSKAPAAAAPELWQAGFLQQQKEAVPYIKKDILPSPKINPTAKSSKSCPSH